MSSDPAERALERQTEEHERQQRADRVTDHTPAPAEWRGGRYQLPQEVVFTTERREYAPHWVARAESGEWWEVGVVESEAIGKLMISLAATGEPAARSAGAREVVDR